MKNSEGITLVALVITIIVLLIVAGASLATLIGYDSIPDNANTAKGEYEKILVDEKKVVNDVEKLLIEYTNLL